MYNIYRIGGRAAGNILISVWRSRHQRVWTHLVLSPNHNLEQITQVGPKDSRMAQRSLQRTPTNRQRISRSARSLDSFLSDSRILTFRLNGGST